MIFGWALHRTRILFVTLDFEVVLAEEVGSALRKKRLWLQFVLLAFHAVWVLVLACTPRVRESKPTATAPAPKVETGRLGAGLPGLETSDVQQHDLAIRHELSLAEQTLQAAGAVSSGKRKKWQAMNYRNLEAWVETTHEKAKKKAVLTRRYEEAIKLLETFAQELSLALFHIAPQDFSEIVSQSVESLLKKKKEELKAERLNIEPYLPGLSDRFSKVRFPTLHAELKSVLSDGEPLWGHSHYEQVMGNCRSTVNFGVLNLKSISERFPWGTLSPELKETISKRAEASVRRWSNSVLECGVLSHARFRILLGHFRDPKHAAFTRHVSNGEKSRP